MKICFMNYKLFRDECKERGFTLAEVLITLGIIGIVATMVIPSLMTKMTTKEFEASAKSSYSNISQAVTSLRQENGSGNFNSVYTTDKEFFDDIAPKFRYTEKIDDAAQAQAKCGTSPTYNLKSGRNILNVDVTACLKLNNGSFLMLANVVGGGGVTPNMPTCSDTPTDPAIAPCALLFVDSNGLKPPNTLPKDVSIVSIFNSYKTALNYLRIYPSQPVGAVINGTVYSFSIAPYDYTQ